jgi:hypothetical protein
VIALGACLPLFLALVILAIGAGAWRGLGRAPTVREAALHASILFGVWVVVGTELLSFLRALAFPGVLAWWAASVAVAAVVTLRCRAALAAWLRQRRRERGRLTVAGQALAGVVGLVLLVAFAAAVLSPPNTGDVLSYHLPRQLYWAQHHTLEHYPTRNARELAFAPLAEYIGVQLMILTGDDRWANLVQWGAAVLALGAVSLIVACLGGSSTAQLFGAALAATNPMFYFMATNAKNDMVLTLWICVLAWLFLRVARDRTGPLLALEIGATIGLALLTKNTASVLVLPLCGAIGLTMIRRERVRTLGMAALVGLCVATLLFGHSWRNVRSFGSPLGPGSYVGGDTSITSTAHTPSAVASTIVRNLALHARFLPPPLDAQLVAAVRSVHAMLGIDIDDRRTTWSRTVFSGRSGLFTESNAPAPVHVLALLGGGVAWLLHFRLARNRRLVVLAASVALGALLFCALIKWQPWHARLHLPLITLGSALLASCRVRPVLARTGVTILIVAALALLVPAILWNNNRPLLTDQSFITRAGSRPKSRVEGLDAAVPTLIARLREHRPASMRVSVYGPARYVVLRALVRELDPPPVLSDLNFRNGPVIRAAPDFVIYFGQAPPRITDPSSGTVFERELTVAPLTLFRPAGPASPDLGSPVGASNPAPGS